MFLIEALMGRERVPKYKNLYKMPKCQNTADINKKEAPDDAHNDVRTQMLWKFIHREHKRHLAVRIIGCKKYETIVSIDVNKMGWINVST